MDKEDVMHTQWNISSKKKNEILPFAGMRMNLEGISEISQTVEDKYHMISLICRI